MKFKTHPHMSDQLTFTKEDLQMLLEGKELRISALEIRMEEEPKKDHVYYGVFEMDGSALMESCFTKINTYGDQIKLTFDGETGKLKSAEVL